MAPVECVRGRAFRCVVGPEDADRTREECCKLSKLETERGLDGTFWLPALDTQRPQRLCALEQLAIDVFEFHSAGRSFDRERSGCEWWTQVRECDPERRVVVSEHGDVGEPPAKRARKAGEPSEVLDRENTGEPSEVLDREITGETIQLHFDKDEMLAGTTGMYVSPAVSTVTYLSAVGAPTVVFPIWVEQAKPRTSGTGGHRASESVENENEIEAESGEGDVDLSFELDPQCPTLVGVPAPGNHLSFDGRLLHGAPSALRPLSTAKPCCGPRVTFLVNVWLDHKPEGIQALERDVAHELSAAAPLVSFNKEMDLTKMDLTKKPSPRQPAGHDPLVLSVDECGVSLQLAWSSPPALRHDEDVEPFWSLESSEITLQPGPDSPSASEGESENGEDDDDDDDN